MDQFARLQAALGQRYAFDHELGRGGTAIVYQAQDLKHDRPVAIKVLDPQTTAGLGTPRFLREIQIAAQLQHPHILPLFDSGQVDGFLFYVMPLVEGESLQELLNRETYVPLEDALRIAAQVAEALAYAHGHGIVHRDIKPGNILLMGGHALVSDFGIARALDAAAGDGVTSAGLIVGTPAYMSPEQCDGSSKLDGRSDIYSLGCVLFEMLAGRPPFPGSGVRAVMAAHLQEEVPSLREFRPQVPAAVEAIVARALAKLPADRFQSAEELSAALTDPSSVPIAGTPPAPGRPDWTKPALLAVATALALWLAVTVLRPSSPHPLTDGGVVVLPFESSNPDVEVATLHRLLENSLSFLPELHVVDGSDLLDPGVGGWRSHVLSELLEGAADRGGAYLLGGEVLEGTGGRTLAVTGYSVATGRRLLHRDVSTVSTDVEEAFDVLALSVAQDLAGLGVEVGVPTYLFGSTASSRAMGHLLDGQEKFYEGDLDGAGMAFDRAIRDDSAFALAYHRRSTVDVWQFDYPAALSSVDAGIAHTATSPREWRDLLRAQRLFVMGQADSLLDLMELYVSDFPDNADGWFLLGSADNTFSSVTGTCPDDAIPRWERSLAISANLAPVHRDIITLGLQRGDEDLARRHLDEVKEDDSFSRSFSRASFDLRFGDATVRTATLEALRNAPRPVLSGLVMYLAEDAANLPLADTLASFLMEPQHPSADQQRGAYYQLVVRAAQGRIEEALPTWNRLRSGDATDLVMVEAYLAGDPVENYALPMLADALAAARAGRAPDYAGDDPWDESRRGFRALVQDAVMHGDSSRVRFLLELLSETMAEAHPSDPMPGNLRAALRGRLALLARDTTEAIRWFETSVAHPVTHLNVYPLMSMAPERLLLAELYTARHDYRRASHWAGTFHRAPALTDILYHRRLEGTEMEIAAAGVALETCGGATARN